MQCKIKTPEWIILIVLTIIIDIVQLIIDLFVIGIVLNRFIDAIIGFGLPIYFWFRGISMNNWKRLLAVVGGFGLEEIGVGGDDGLPLWTAEVGVVWATVIADNKLAASPLAGKVINAAQMASRVRAPANQDGVRLPGGQSENASPANAHIAPAPKNIDGVRRPGNP